MVYMGMLQVEGEIVPVFLSFVFLWLVSTALRACAPTGLGGKGARRMMTLLSVVLTVRSAVPQVGVPGVAASVTGILAAGMVIYLEFDNHEGLHLVAPWA